MRYRVLACDYDGTLATHGKVEEAVIEQLERLRSAGRRLILVTGRQLGDLVEVFPQINLFDLLVVENGAVLYSPGTRDEILLCDPPEDEFVQALKERGVAPVSVGRAIVATWHPHETTVLEVIRDLGLELEIIFNKGAVMVLPTGVTKATGFARALAELGLSRHNAVAVGDAENDHALLHASECAVAVDNALPVLKHHADFVTSSGHGTGVIELMQEMLKDDLASIEPKLKRHHIFLGQREEGEKVSFPPYGTTLLVAGPSGSGKSTTALAVLEHLSDAGYQFCLIDPEGDYGSFEGAVILGTTQRAPSIEEVVSLLRNPSTNVVVNLLGISMEDRPEFFGKLILRLQELRAKSGRPHWLVVDEAHHLFPLGWDHLSDGYALDPQVDMLITVHPDHVAPSILSKVNTVIAVGKFPQDTIRTFCTAAGKTPPDLELARVQSGQVLTWFMERDQAPFGVHVALPRSERCRHRRKYAEGDVGQEKSFFFVGPHGKLKLRAQNLVIFAQIADGVDDDTWLYHLRRGDYSKWFQDQIKDESLAAVAGTIERDQELSADDSRELIRKAIKERYGVPC